MQRTHREESYGRYNVPQRIDERNQGLKCRQTIANTLRPPQALNFKIPLQVFYQFGILPPGLPPLAVSNVLNSPGVAEPQFLL